LYFRLSIKQCVLPVERFGTQSGPLAFRATPCLGSEPAKKKKRVDVQLVASKVNRRKKKIEKAIKKLELGGRIFKPIVELEIPIDVKRSAKERKREQVVHTFEDSEKRALLQKEWSKYRFKSYIQQCSTIDMLVRSQTKALTELRKVSEELYQQAIETDPALMSLELTGPVETPPTEGYYSPDGDYKDTTNYYDKE
jgi:large subunit ribosomal protein L40